jgi:hypothetical protein
MRKIRKYWLYVTNISEHPVGLICEGEAKAKFDP